MGRGAGMGKHHGLTLEEIRASFEICERDPSMRSVSAVLRITREQLNARGELGLYPPASAIMGILGVAALAGMRFAGPELRTMLIQAAAGCGGLSIMLLYGVYSTRDVRSANVAQERAIRALAIYSLERIIAHDFRRKPLLREQDQTVRELLKTQPQSSIRTLLDFEE